MTFTVIFEPQEQYYAQQGFPYVCGVDEAGRGPLAGPVYAAAVILRPEADFPGLNDSKKLSEKTREALFDQICAQSIAYQIVSVGEDVIDEINILNATMQAMQQAVEGLCPAASFALIDGNRLPRLSVPGRAIVGGDARVKSIAAASVLAKVSRDRKMYELAKQYPQYAFEKHKGYGTRLHYEMLDRYGPSPIHRQSFLKKYFEAKAHED